MNTTNDCYRRWQGTVSDCQQPLLDAVCTLVEGCSRRQAREAILAGLVTVDQALTTDPKAPAAAGAHLDVDLTHGIPHHKARKSGAVTRPGDKPFRILFADSDLVVVDKAAGILSAPGGEDEEGRDHVLAALRQAWRKQGREVPYLGVVHRIDLATSGCLVIALNKPAQNILQAQFAGEGAGRNYTALVLGNPRRDQDTLTGFIGRGPDGRRALVRDPSQGKSVITHFVVRQRFAQACRLELTLATGRTHQIRVHCAAIGSPVLGDPLYNRESGKAARKVAGAHLQLRLPRMMLHAHQVSFDHPRHGKRMTVNAPLPAEFAQVEKALSKDPGPQEQQAAPPKTRKHTL